MIFQRILNFYKISPAIPPKAEYSKAEMNRLKKLKWSFFLTATFGYGLYYICRLSLNVIKKPIIDTGLFSETELGIIGSALFFAYAAGKLFNGFMADRSNIKRFFATGLLVAALANLCLGFMHTFVFFAVLWGFSGWFQSMGAPSCIVGLTRWYDDSQRGSFYGFWSASHNIGEGMTPIVIAAIVTPPDVVSQLLLAIPMCLLYEVGLWGARWFVPARKQTPPTHESTPESAPESTP